MRLTTLKLENFRRFDQLDLSPLDPDLTVIVGPNGAGKSTLFHALNLVNLALSWSGEIDSNAYNQLQGYQSVLKRNATAKQLAVRAGMDFTESWEKDLWLGYIRAAIASAVAERQPPPDPSALDRLLSSISLESLGALLDGRLVVSYISRPVPSWIVGYEFEHGLQDYYFGLQGGVFMGHILAGKLPTQPSSGLRTVDLPSRITDYLTHSKPFSLELLLPSGDEGIAAQVRGHLGSRSQAVSDFVTSIGAMANVGRDYSLANVLNPIVKANLALISDQRLPPITTYSSSDLGKRPSLIDGANVPLELFRLKNGGIPERSRYDAVKALFGILTGRSLELRANPADQSGERMTIEPVVVEQSWEVPITLAGAGAWEALILSTILCGEPGMVAALDEPAVNLAPTLQRRLTGQLTERQATQVLLITHSPFLVPMRNAADLRRIVRISANVSGGAATSRRLADVVSGETTVPGLGPHWRQLLAGRADVRGTLFASGVILVEGETELGAFDQWFREAESQGVILPSPDSLNVQLLSVGGDNLFGPYVGYLEALGIPWVIVSDGPVLSPRYKDAIPLIEQLKAINVVGPPTTTPGDSAPFDEWRVYWEARHTFTLASTFGGLDKDAKDKTGEIEAFFESIDGARWAGVKSQYPKSKVRQGHAFAEAVRCPTRVQELYQRLIKLLVA